MTSQSPLFPTDTTGLETKEGLIPALFSRQSSARVCETITSPSRGHTKGSGETVRLKWPALGSRLQILLFIRDWTSTLLLSVFLCQSITVMLYPTIALSNRINSRKTTCGDLLSHETIFTCANSQHKDPATKATSHVPLQLLHTQYDHQRRNICSQPWLQIDF